MQGITVEKFTIYGASDGPVPQIVLHVGQRVGQIIFGGGVAGLEAAPLLRFTARPGWLVLSLGGRQLVLSASLIKRQILSKPASLLDSMVHALSNTFILWHTCSHTDVGQQWDSMKNQLTVRKIDALKAKDTRYRVTDGEGLFVEVMPTGKRVFRARIAEGGRRVDVTYGSYPEISLSDARRIHEERCAKRGAVKEDVFTFKDAFEAWLPAYSATPSARTKHVPKPKTIKRNQYRFDNYLAPLHGRPLSDLRRRELITLLDGMPQREEARQCFNLLNMIFEWAVIREYVEYSPLSGIHAKTVGLTAKKPKQRVISAVALAEVWAHCGDNPSGRAAKVLILTGARRGMVAHMRWDEIEGDWWHVPGDKMKSYEAQSIFITFHDVIEDLRMLQGPESKGWVFESSDSLLGHIWPESITGYIADIAKRLGLDFSTHDIRRSVRTAWAEELKVSNDLGELMIAHKPGKLVGTYNKARMLEDQKATWIAWAALLERYRQWVALRDFLVRFFGHSSNG